MLVIGSRNVHPAAKSTGLGSRDLRDTSVNLANVTSSIHETFRQEVSFHLPVNSPDAMRIIKDIAPRFRDLNSCNLLKRM